MSSVYCAAFCLSTCVATWDTRHAWTGRGAGAAHLYLIFFQHSTEQQIMVGKKILHVRSTQHRACLDPFKILKFYKIFYHIESLSVYIKY
jgi:hypothetical protein